MLQFILVLLFCPGISTGVKEVESKAPHWKKQDGSRAVDKAIEEGRVRQEWVCFSEGEKKEEFNVNLVEIKSPDKVAGLWFKAQRKGYSPRPGRTVLTLNWTVPVEALKHGENELFLMKGEVAEGRMPKFFAVVLPDKRLSIYFERRSWKTTDMSRIEGYPVEREEGDE